MNRTSTAEIGLKVAAACLEGKVTRVVAGHCSKRLVVKVEFAGSRHYGYYFADEVTEI